jgi:hypothetical protein
VSTFLSKGPHDGVFRQMNARRSPFRRVWIVLRKCDGPFAVDESAPRAALEDLLSVDAGAAEF